MALKWSLLSCAPVQTEHITLLRDDNTESEGKATILKPSEGIKHGSLGVF